MSIMATSSNKIADSFPYSKLTKIVGKPDYTSVARLKNELCANAVSVPSARGNGRLGHVALVIGTPAYNARVGPEAIAADPANPNALNWTDPPNPGPNPVYPAPPPPGAPTAMQINAANNTFNNAKREFDTHVAVNVTLKSMLVAAVEQDYLSFLEDDEFGLAQVSIVQIMNHLMTTYGEVTDNDLRANRLTLESPWTPTDSMDPLWKLGTEAQRLARQGGNPISDEELLRLHRSAIDASGVFAMDMAFWDRRPLAERSLPTFRTHFNEANKRRSQAVPSNVGAYTKTEGGANSLTGAGKAFAAAGSGTPASLQHVIAAVNKSAPSTNHGGTPAKGSILFSSDGQYWGYCWSHGLGPDGSHTSASCRSKLNGHQQDATIIDMKGGNNSVRRPKGQFSLYRNTSLLVSVTTTSTLLI